MERDIAEAMLAQSRLLPKKSGKNLDSEPVGSFLTPSSPIKKTTLTVVFFIGELDSHELAQNLVININFFLNHRSEVLAMKEQVQMIKGLLAA